MLNYDLAIEKNPELDKYSVSMIFSYLDNKIVKEDIRLTQR